ncbi:MAG TPA: tetratricopeptide repeat protein, partial [Myxococcota bacterium]|nr:tetratricopeptide repeat protein [Myxococcota bacterium]
MATGSAPRFRWLKVRPLHEPRASPVCSLLADGRVRVVGGSYYDLGTYRMREAGVEIYAPAEDRWTRGDLSGVGRLTASPRARPPGHSGAPLAKRERPTWTRLPSGQWLVTGGFETTCRFDGEEDDHSFGQAELFDPGTRAVSDAGRLPVATHDHGVVVLACGALLVIGGNEGDTQGSRAVQLGVPAGLDLAALGPALSRLARKEFLGQQREEAIEEAHRLSAAGQHDAALSLAREAAAASPRSADAWRAVGLALAAAGLHSEALEPLRRAAALEPGSPFLQAELADALFACGRRRLARRRYERVLALCSDDPTWTWLPLQRARQQLQLLALEDGELERVAREPGPSATSLEWNNAGVAAQRLGRDQDARERFARAVEIDPQNDFAWCNLASSLAALRRPQEALRAARRAIGLCVDPLRLAQAHLSRGVALHDLGRYARSIEAYDASLSSHPLPEAWHNRANSLRKLARDDEALASYGEACALGHAAAFWGRACILALRGDLARARAEVARAVRLDPALERQMRADPELAPLFPEVPRARPGSRP